MGLRSRRVRQHVNPLGLKYTQPRAEAVARPAHLGPSCPVDVELGCADGKFTFELAQRHPDRFVVGLDIRDKLVELGRERALRRRVPNVAFAYVNMGVDLDRVFGPRSVDRFHLLFPDPWFKTKHRKRRVIAPGLCESIRHQLRPGGELHVASDVFEVALDAMAELEHPDVATLGFANMAGAWSFWRGNPYNATSRREDITRRRGQRVWRLRYCVGSGSAGSGSASPSCSQRSYG